jgi:hypothetical protein
LAETTVSGSAAGLGCRLVEATLQAAQTKKARFDLTVNKNEEGVRAG